MLVTAVLFAVVGAVAAQFPPQHSTCASTTCLVGRTCKEVYNPVTGVVQSTCLSNVRPTGNENVCRDGGQPLYVNSSTLGVVEINCGLSFTRIDCVHGYYCNVHPADAYAVCCPGNGAAPLTEKPGECPAAGKLRCLRIKNCNGDQSCPGDQKCCKNRCGGYYCVASVAPTGPTCNNTPCPAGQNCVMQAVVCKKAPCFPVRTCVSIERPGVCPAPSPLGGACAFIPGYNCLGDTACPAGQKCCSEGCGRICKNVV